MNSDPSGRRKVFKRDRQIFMAGLAETIIDPDEIWIGVTAVRLPGFPGTVEYVLERRYVRADDQSGMIGVFQIGRRWWGQTTIYPTADSKGRPSLKLLDGRRGGKLLWSRLPGMEKRRR